MKRVIFRATSSHFLLSATIQYHLINTTGSTSKTAQVLLTSFDADDLVVGAQSKEALVLPNDVNDIMITAGMTIKK